MNIYKTKWDDEVIFIYANCVDDAVKKIKEYYLDFDVNLDGPFIYVSNEEELKNFKAEHSIIGRI